MAEAIIIPKMQPGEDFEAYAERVRTAMRAAREVDPDVAIQMQGNPVNVNVSTPSGATRAKRWKENLGSGTTKEKYQAGVQNPQRDPVEAAIDEADKWQSNVSEEKAKRKFKGKLRAAGSSAVKQAAATTGAENLVRSATQKVGKTERAQNILAPLQQEIKTIIAGMDKKTISDSKARMDRNFDEHVKLGDAYLEKIAPGGG